MCSVQITLATIIIAVDSVVVALERVVVSENFVHVSNDSISESIHCIHISLDNFVVTCEGGIIALHCVCLGQVLGGLLLWGTRCVTHDNEMDVIYVWSVKYHVAIA